MLLRRLAALMLPLSPYHIQRNIFGNKIRRLSLRAAAAVSRLLRAAAIERSDNHEYSNETR